MANLITYRQYFKNYTASDAWCNGELLCRFLELPWKDNKTDISCIPEGRYTCYYDRNINKYWVTGVQGRNYIQIHRGNTVNDIKGCLCAVTKIMFGVGYLSIKAFNRLHNIMGDRFELIITNGVYIDLTGDIRHENIKPNVAVT
jgi:hypothetical protein